VARSLARGDSVGPIIAAVLPSKRLAIAVCSAGALAIGALSGATAQAQPSPSVRAGVTAVAALSAQLRVADRHPLQLHGVLLDASGSTGDISTYAFHFGDGVVEQSYQPLALHGYRTPGTYHATVVVIDAAGHQRTSASVRIKVRDGIPPVVRINVPRPNQRVRLGPSGLRLSGKVSDNVGVARVQLAIELVASRRHFQTHGACIWYDSHQFLLLSACGAPFFFNAQARHGRWSFRIDPGATIPKGTYVVRVRAIDRAGNISHFFAVGLRTILPFDLV
jgi:hypothetical protein